MPEIWSGGMISRRRMLQAGSVMVGGTPAGACTSRVPGPAGHHPGVPISAALENTFIKLVQQIVQDEVRVGIVHHKKQLTAWSTGLQGFKPMSTAGLSFDGVTAA